MGTSSSYTAPTTGDWRRFKSTMTQYLTGRGEAARVGRDYVAAIGGAVQGAKRLTALHEAADRLGGFLSSASQGFTDALEQIGLGEVVGKDFDTIISALVDWVAGPGDSQENIVSRVVTADILTDLYKEAEIDPTLWDAISRDRVTEDALEMALIKFVEKWIIEDVWTRVGDRAELWELPSHERRSREAEFEDYVTQAVVFNFGDHGEIDLRKANWDSPEVRETIGMLVQTALMILGAAE